MSSFRFSAPALLLAALLPAGLQGQTATPEPAEAPVAASVSDHTTLTVKNYNWLDMRVYMVRNGARVPLGYVTSMAERTFVVPEAALGAGGQGARVVVDPVGSRYGWASEALNFVPGDHLEARIQNHLAVSYVTFRDVRGM
jgi:hypothetical protein